MTDTAQINVTSMDSLATHGIDKAVVAIGVFDGVHLGHRKLLSRLIEMSKREKASPVALTFHPHPRELLQPDTPPSLLAPHEAKLRMLHECGAKAVITIPFTREFASLSPKEFLEDCLYSPRVELKGICVGSKWRFGAKGSGDTKFLKECSKSAGFAFESVDELLLHGKPVSSSSIRRAVSSGDLSLAKEMLGRDYSLHGVVEEGLHIAGSSLSHPTANLRVRHEALPPNGVYAGYAKLDGKSLPAAIAVGVSPTFHGAAGGGPRVEVHIIGFSGDLYGREMEAELVAYMREERCFPDAATLKSQIAADVKAALEILKERRT